jgi:hypothetical protein
MRNNVRIQINWKHFMSDIVAKLRGVKLEVLEGRLRVEFAGEREIDCEGAAR